MRLKHASSFIAGGTPSVDDESMWEEGEDGGLPWISIGDMSRSTTISHTSRRISHKGIEARRLQIGQPGTVLFAMYASVGAVATLTESATWNQALIGVVPKHGMADSRFLAFWLQHAARDAMADVRSSTQNNLNADQVANFPFPNIDLQDQSRIADFLDAQLSRIDNIISARRGQAKMARDRLSAIAEAETISAFPADAGDRLKYLYDVIHERAGSRNLPLLSVSIHRGVIPRSSITDDEARADDLSGYKVSQPGDIVLNRMRAFQGAIGINRQIGIVSPDYLVLRPNSVVRADWLHYVFRSNWFVGEMVARLRGIGSVELGSVRTPRINSADLGEIKLQLPDLAEQLRVVGTLALAQRTCEGVVESLEVSIALLAEYKQSLITAAVTGELDVTTASTRIPA